ncbi:hypothetical protein RJT34_04238 [Clitoria ternatea]|uniref:Legume lectin domain-containing protein n=1 Tax=Clitoria ternatea TaxID=43366 RepID=A0AAN9Q2F9_CLITE
MFVNTGQLSNHEHGLQPLANYIVQRLPVLRPYGDGLAFFLASPNLTSTNDTQQLRGGGLGIGLVDLDQNLIQTPYQFVAVEFDTFSNEWDPDGAHVGVNLNDMESAIIETWRPNITRGEVCNCIIQYDSRHQSLDVFYSALKFTGGNVTNTTKQLSCNVDITDHLPEWVIVGISAATGGCFEEHTLLSWSFRTSLPSSPPPRNAGPKKVKNSIHLKLLEGIAIGTALFWSLFVLVHLSLSKMDKGKQEEESTSEATSDQNMNDGFQMSTGPKKISYYELVACGRKAIHYRDLEGEVSLVQWVWELYGMGNLLAAADPKLCGVFDVQQMECLLVVGLWCANPDCTSRPSIRQVIKVLNCEAPLPILPQRIPMLTYVCPMTNELFITVSSSLKATPTVKGENDQIKAKISNSLRRVWHERLKSKRLGEQFVLSWEQCLANAAKKGGSGQEELDWDSYDKIKQQLEPCQLLQTEKKKKKKKKPMTVCGAKKFIQSWRESIAKAAKKGGNGEQELDWDSYEKIQEEMAFLRQLQHTTKKEKAKEMARVEKAKEAASIKAIIKKVMLPQKRKDRHEKAKARRNTKSPLYRSAKEHEAALEVTQEFKLHSKFTKIHPSKSNGSEVAREGKVFNSIFRTDNKLDLELIKRVKMQKEISLADQIKAVRDQKGKLQQ